MLNLDTIAEAYASPEITLNGKVYRANRPLSVLDVVRMSKAFGAADSDLEKLVELCRETFTLAGGLPVEELLALPPVRLKATLEYFFEYLFGMPTQNSETTNGHSSQSSPNSSALKERKRK